MAADKVLARRKRHKRVRIKVSGTSQRPRLNIYKSLNYTYAQIIDDTIGNTLVYISTNSKEFRDIKGHKGNIEFAKKIGAIIAQKAIAKNIKTIVYDKGSFKYHGRIKAVADAARKAGLIF